MHQSLRRRSERINGLADRQLGDVALSGRARAVCQHPELAAIEADYLRWQTVESLRVKYDLPENSHNRHIKAYGLDEKLRGNKLVGLEQIMSMGLTHIKPEAVTAANVVAAAQLHAKLQGELVDRTEDVTAQLERATDEELSFYALHGRIPDPGELDAASDDTEH